MDAERPSSQNNLLILDFQNERGLNLLSNYPAFSPIILP